MKPSISALLPAFFCLAATVSGDPAGLTKTSTPTTAPPGPAFPGQHAGPSPDWKYPVWPSSCGRFQAEERVACLEFVAFDFGRLSRYADTNSLLASPQPGEKRVVFFGDSITDMWSAPEYGGFFPGKPYVNRGISGQTTAQMLVRFRQDVIALQPEVVVILAGTNDIAGNSGPVSLSIVEDNLATMSELARCHGIEVVLASLLPVSDDKLDRDGRPRLQTRSRPPEKIRALNTWLSSFAQENRFVYLDYFSAVSDAEGRLSSELTDDGLHPNKAGYAVMAPLAEKAIAAALATVPES